MKSTSSFTVLPDFGLYCSSKNFFMMRVGGQSGTAIVSVTSSAYADIVPPVISVAAKPAAATMPLIFVDTVIFRFPPFSVPFFSFWPRASGDHLPARSSEDVELAWIENHGRLLPRLQARRSGFRQHHAQRL